MDYQPAEVPSREKIPTPREDLPLPERLLEITI
jgi:hypothetical protein